MTGLLDALRAKLRDTETELTNPALLQITRRQLEARAERLRLELQELLHPTPFREQGSHSGPPMGYGQGWPEGGDQ